MENFDKAWADAGTKTEYEPLPSGEYAADITAAVLEEEPGEGWQESWGEFKPRVKWEFTIQGDEYDGRKLWVNNHLTPKALYRLKNNLQNCGQVIESKAQLPTALGNCLNKTVKVNVSQNSYMGKVRNDAEIVAPDKDDDLPF